MTHRLLHFTLGPVQGFVADARRTRDLWAGSFLLSWLSGQAMAKLVGDEIAEIVFPETDGDELLDAILSHRSGDEPGGCPHIGSLPNRFKARLTSRVSNAGPSCRDAVMDRWVALCDAVWDQFIGQIDIGRELRREIWDRQTKAFWDMSWVEGEDDGKDDDGPWLDQRKNWRSHLPIDPSGEGGDHCRLMGQFQEISGHNRIGREDQDRQRVFWEALSEQTYLHPGSGQRRQIGELNLRADERLCAIALVKRLFPLLDDIETVIGWRPGGEDFNVINWPSVSFIAAVPWLRAVERDAPTAGDDYVVTVKDCVKDGRFGTDPTVFSFPNTEFFSLDGHLLHKDAIETMKSERLTGVQGEHAARRQQLLQGHRDLCDAVVADKSVKPSEFYALLLMDGDRIGKLLRDPELGPKVKGGLARFTGSVKTFFSGRNAANGALIYAGGDDVLAVLPVDSAISAARAIRKLYSQAFEEAVIGEGKAVSVSKAFTMSAAVVFAQFKIPLRAVLGRAHHYLDDIAKTENGRDSLAIAVVKPGGVACDWVSCWGERIMPPAILEELARDLQDDSEVSANLFYNLRDRYGPLFYSGEDGTEDDQRDGPTVFGHAAFMEAVLRVECGKGRDGRGEGDDGDAQAVEGVVAQLMAIGQPLRRDEDGPAEPIEGYNFDSGLVARFLSVEARWNLESEADR